jgi:hypothetical protein
MRFAITVCAAAAGALVLGCSDTSPPTWPEGAELEVKDVTATTATLDWPPALDDDAVAGYRIFKQDEKIAEVGAGAAFHELDGLTEAQELTFGIEPFDAAGNTGERLDLAFRTADETAPTWPASAELKIEKTTVEPAGEPAEGAGQPTEYELVLTWPEADDNLGVTTYRVKKGTAVLVEIGAEEERVFKTKTAKPDGLYAIEAGDAGKNWSEGLVKAEGSLSTALSDALGGEAGVLKLLGDTSASAPTLGIGGLKIGGDKPVVPIDASKGIGGIAPGSLIGKDSKLEAPAGDLSLDLLEDDNKAPKTE